MRKSISLSQSLTNQALFMNSTWLYIMLPILTMSSMHIERFKLKTGLSAALEICLNRGLC